MQYKLVPTHCSVYLKKKRLFVVICNEDSICKSVLPIVDNFYKPNKKIVVLGLDSIRNSLHLFTAIQICSFIHDLKSRWKTHAITHTEVMGQ